MSDHETSKRPAGPLAGRIGVNRRQFLGDGARTAAGAVAGGVAFAQSAAAGPHDQDQPVRLGVIGVRHQGRPLAKSFAAIEGCRVTSVCDVDASVMTRTARELAEQSGVAPGIESDYRRILDAPEIDAIAIATPDHWHAQMIRDAVEAGKDVYVEPPLTRTLAELDGLSETIEANDRIVCVGLSQRGSTAFAEAMNYLRSGNIGHVRLAKAWAVNMRKPIPQRADSAEPNGVDYAAWLGPSGPRPFNANRFHRNWSSFWDYGCGELGLWGPHLLDVAALGLGVTLPTRVTAAGLTAAPPQETPDSLNVTYDYGDRIIQWEHREWSRRGPEGRNAAVAFYGTKGTLILDRGGWKVIDGEATAGRSIGFDPRSYLRSFLESIRSRQTAFDYESTSLSTRLCHLGNQAFREAREIRIG
ncbi:Gfo/Idh/MocA family protein [Stratiformator vulcanicus]|uniref:Inositol 2-dehydrogenase n=1 Tax=Stratiformator vulcanicus TaxID=2527980 RepID=A0A517R2N8_9PLAN|nr:Gfo/Idh/MocA family oxidoreductase [Stratiformator vulcanicus]QDT38147.1 Inositol 2-dehydrogenase [Stratiformator vulcanicus]